MNQDGLIGHEVIIDTMRTWLHKHASDVHAGLMLRDFLDGNCAHDFVALSSGRCELCGSLELPGDNGG